MARERAFAPRSHILIGDNNKKTDCDGQNCRVHDPLPIRGHVCAGRSETEIRFQPAEVYGA